MNGMKYMWPENGQRGLNTRGKEVDERLDIQVAMKWMNG